MTKTELVTKTAARKEETREALQTVYDELNNGQRKKLIKNEKIKEMFDRYGVEYGGDK